MSRNMNIVTMARQKVEKNRKGDWHTINPFFEVTALWIVVIQISASEGIIIQLI